MDIYNDYANWKFENHEFIYKLVSNRSKTISRFTSVIVVVDYLYEQYVKNHKLTKEEEIFFSIGFDYIYDNFYTIKTILDYKFNGDYVEMEKFSKTINLLLYVNEFQSELLNYNLDTKQLDDFEAKVNDYLDKKENVPDEFFPILNEITASLFEKNNIELNPNESINYDIALEYKIYKNNDVDIYNAVFNFQKEKHKNDQKS